MGTFYTHIQIENHYQRNKLIDIPCILVDTGSELSWISEKILDEMGVLREKKDYSFVMANGSTITRQIGYLIFHVGDHVTIDEVVFAQKGDLQILGARTLEGLNLRVDTRNKKLVAAGPHLAAAA